jgi:hypothetical protein
MHLIEMICIKYLKLKEQKITLFLWIDNLRRKVEIKDEKNLWNLRF